MRECIYIQEAKEAYESLLIVRPRRPVSVEFIELEKIVMQQALVLYNYTWPEGAEVSMRLFK